MSRHSSLLVCLLTAAVFWIGYFGGRRDGSSAPHEPPVPAGVLSGDVTILRMNRPADSGVPTHLRPHACTVGGRTTLLGTPPENVGDVWIVRLDGGRVVLSASEVTAAGEP
jgi:hypothetical protein